MSRNATTQSAARKMGSAHEDFLEHIKQEKLKQTLRERERQFQLITECVPVTVAFVDTKKHYRYVNEYYEKWIGLPRSEILGNHMRTVIGYGSYHEYKQHIDLALSGQKVRFECKLPTTPQRAERYGDVHYIPDIDDQGEVNGFYVLVSDISELKNAEEKHEKLEKKWRSLWENIPDTIAELDLDGTILIINKLLPELTLENVIGKSALNYIPEYQQSALNHALEKAKRTKKTAYYEIPIVTAKSHTWWSNRIVPVIKDNKVTSLLMIATDITEAKKSEQELKNKNMELERLMETMAGRELLIKDLQEENEWMKKKLKKL